MPGSGNPGVGQRATHGRVDNHEEQADQQDRNRSDVGSGPADRSAVAVAINM
jgi:hypothetical protein